MTNLMSLAYVGVLIGMLTAAAPPAFASSGPDKPIMLDYKCDPGYRLIGGKCMKTEVIPLQERCANPGYIRAGSYCKKAESQKATIVCPANHVWDKEPFPEQCSYAFDSDSTRWKTNGAGESGERIHVPCTNSLKSPHYQKVGSVCYLAQPAESINCPTDAASATPTTVSVSCNDMAQAMGQCDAASGTYTTPDMRWKLNRATYMCSRTLYGGIEKYCPTGYEQQDGECKKVTLKDVTASCKAGYYRRGNQCFPGSAPSCGAGTTMRYGVCVAADGSLSCPSGQYLEASSNMCVKNRTDSQPATFDSSDFNYFYNQGATLGGFAADSISMPSVGASNTGVNANAEFMNAKTKLTDGDLFKSVSTGGVDANNGFSKPDGTYQNEEKQGEFIRSRLDENEDFLKTQAATPGATSEEIVDNTNHSAVAYGALMDSRNLNPKRKVSRDSAMFQTSREAVSDAFTGKGAYFGDCSDENTTYRELDEDKIVTTKQTCLKPNKNNLSGCIVDRILHKPTLNIIEGADNAKVQVCGEKCVRLTLGKTGDNYLPQYGSCGIYKEKIAIGLLKGNRVNKATLISGSYDDHFRLKADGVTFYNGVHGSFPTADGFPTSSTSCERSKSRSVARADVTSAFQNAFAGDDRIDFDYQVGVGGDGEAYAVVELLFDKEVSTRWSEEFRYSPAGCNEKLNDPKTFCTADQFTCDKEVKWTPVYLGDWATEDSNGKWEVQANPNDVMQEVNGEPTSYISEKGYELNSFKGNIKVATSDDDDFIGFIFGVPEKGADLTKPENSYYLVSWKQGNQKGAVRGFVLAKVTGPMNTIPWAHQNSGPGYKVLATNLGSGWGDNRAYEFLLEVRPDHFTLSVDGIEKMSVAGAFHKGRVGFYNNSQGSVIYSQVKQLYPAGLGRDAEFLFKPLWSGASKYPVCMSGHRPNYVCDPLKGKKLSMNGGHFGFKDIIKMNDACSSLDKDTECDAISQECLPGWKDEATNTCYAWNVNYECQDTSNAVVTKVRKNNSCMTDIDCIDGSCDVRADEESTDFVNALTTYATMNELGATKKCSDPSDPATCEVFSGNPRWCAWDQLKINDCCEQPPGVNTLNVFTLGQNLYTVTGYTASAEGAFAGSPIQTGLEAAGQAVEGVWNNLKDPIVDAASTAWDAVSSKLTGAVGNTAGNTSANLVSSSGSVIGNFSTAVTQAMTNFKNTLLQEIYNLLPEALQGAIQGAAQALGGSAGATGAAAMNTIGANVMAVVSFIGWAYAVYQLAKLAYTMLTACEKVEEDMGVMLLGKKCFKTSHKSCKKVFGVCTNRYKNFYCCYESVISRIIMEQAIVQLGWNPKTFRDSMKCRGLKISELSRVDFSKIDFTEWVSMMAQSNQLPEGKDMDAITEGNISNGFGRSNTLDRNQDRAPDNAWVKRRTEMEQGDIGNNVNCNKRPRPKSCDQDAYTPNN